MGPEAYSVLLVVVGKLYGWRTAERLARRAYGVRRVAAAAAQRPYDDEVDAIAALTRWASETKQRIIDSPAFASAWVGAFGS